MSISSKIELVNAPTIKVDKNVITYGNSFICTDNISLITISPIPSNRTWIGAIMLGLISIPIIKLHFFGILLLISAIIWFIAVVNYNNNRGETLAISLNSGTTLYFNCKDKTFLGQVISAMIDSIKNKNQSTYSINFETCTINGGALNNATFIGK